MSNRQYMPHNDDIEAVVVATVLADNLLFHEVDDISAAHFHDEAMAEIWRMASARIAAGSRADALTLSGEFSQQLERDANDDQNVLFDAVDYLNKLMGSGIAGTGAAAAVLREYADTLVDLAARRQLVDHARTITQRAQDQNFEQSALDILNQAEGMFADVSGLFGSKDELSTPSAGLDAVWETTDQIRQGAPVAVGIKTGYRNLDRVLGHMEPGDLIICAGRSSMGKTACSAEVARSIAFQGLKVGFFSVADMTRTQLWQRMILTAAKRAGAILAIDDLKTARFHSDMDEDDARRATQELRDRLQGHFMMSDARDLTVSQIRRSARAMAREMGGLDLIIVDYVQRVREDSRSRGRSRAEAVGDITGDLKKMAGELGCVVWANAQLSRAVEARDDKRPRLSDLKESGSIEEDADSVIFAYRPEYYLRREQPDANSKGYQDWDDAMVAARDRLELIVAKNR